MPYDAMHSCQPSLGGDGYGLQRISGGRHGSHANVPTQDGYERDEARHNHRSGDLRDTLGKRALEGATDHRRNCEDELEEGELPPDRVKSSRTEGRDGQEGGREPKASKAPTFPRDGSGGRHDGRSAIPIVRNGYVIPRANVCALFLSPSLPGGYGTHLCQFLSPRLIPTLKHRYQIDGRDSGAERGRGTVSKISDKGFGFIAHSNGALFSWRLQRPPLDMCCRQCLQQRQWWQAAAQEHGPAVSPSAASRLG